LYNNNPSSGGHTLGQPPVPRKVNGLRPYCIVRPRKTPIGRLIECYGRIRLCVLIMSLFPGGIRSSRENKKTLPWQSVLGTLHTRRPALTGETNANLAEIPRTLGHRRTRNDQEIGTCRTWLHCFVPTRHFSLFTVAGTSLLALKKQN